jgi:hypothetical protein
VDFVPYRYDVVPVASGTRSTLNLFRGWPLVPDAEPNPAPRCGRFLEHVYENVCQGNDALFAWVLGWLAEIVQRPAQKSGTALVLRGTQGVGKSIVAQAMRSLLGASYLLVSSPERVTGRFNGYLASRLLVFLDEATWGGDHTAAGVLKDLITSDTLFVERKGIEAFTVSNYVRLLISSNNSWVVPAGQDERRFAVLDVGEGRKQDRAYFGALLDEQARGGAEALFAYLLAYDLTTVDVGRIPETTALREQQVRSLPPEDAWWLDVLRAGELPADRLRTAGVCECRALYASYIEHAKSAGIARRMSDAALGHFLRRQIPYARRQRARLADGARPWALELPPLRACRESAPAGSDQSWDDPDAEWQVTPS